MRVLRAAIDSGAGDQQSGTACCDSGALSGAGGTGACTGQRRETKQLDKRPPVCFHCSRADSRHYLASYKEFKQISSREKRQAVFDAKRCLNCLSQEHLFEFARFVLNAGLANIGVKTSMQLLYMIHMFRTSYNSAKCGQTQTIRRGN